jgi:peptidoglycan/LPS O-acetylase OafA/YrhL
MSTCFWSCRGFLITSILIREIEEGCYPSHFYNVLAHPKPVLFVVTVTMIVARPLMLPWQYDEELVINALPLFFVSNFLSLAKNSGYLMLELMKNHPAHLSLAGGGAVPFYSRCCFFVLQRSRLG